jgi:hypothetical protein
LGAANDPVEPEDPSDDAFDAFAGLYTFAHHLFAEYAPVLLDPHEDHFEVDLERDGLEVGGESASG